MSKASSYKNVGKASSFLVAIIDRCCAFTEAAQAATA